MCMVCSLISIYSMCTCVYMPYRYIMLIIGLGIGWDSEIDYQMDW